MIKAATLFSFFCGLAMLGVWAMLLLSGQVTELTTAPVEASFLLAAEFATATALLAGGYGLLRGRAWGARAEVAALGMLLYCTIYSIGVFGQQHNLPAAGFFVVVATLALVFCIYFVRTAGVRTARG